MTVLRLFLDFETKSRISLKNQGLDVYARHESTEVLMLSYAVEEQLPQVWFPHEGPMPEKLAVLLLHPGIIKVAWNVPFERAIFKHVLKIDIPLEQWLDPKIMAHYLSIAGGLEMVGKVLGLGEDEAKLSAGKKLIRLFCMPNKADGFNDWNSHPIEWAQFVDYAKRDVSSERTILQKIKGFMLPPLERRLWLLDQKINEFGLHVDRQFVQSAQVLVDAERERLMLEMRALTNLVNPNSVKQLLSYLQGEGYPFKSLNAKFTVRGEKEAGLTANGLRALQLRKELSKSSTAKLVSLANFTGPDDYARHTLAFMGAAASARWSSKNIQIQNFPRGSIKSDQYDAAIAAIKSGKLERVQEFGNPMNVISSCLRGAFRAPDGSRWVVSDLSAIDSRSLAWLSGCKKILDIYHAKLDLYSSFGMSFYNLPYDVIRNDKAMRLVCKVITLSCGYGLGPGAEKTDKNGDEYKSGLWGMLDAAKIDLSQEDAQRGVQLFRTEYEEIPRFWREVESAVMTTLRTGETQRVAGGKLMIGCVPTKILWVALPSGRRLHFLRPRLEPVEGFNGEMVAGITYEGLDRRHQWSRLKSWGGHFVGIITQAVARDFFANGLLAADAAGFHIAGLVHDEAVCCESEQDKSAPLLDSCLTQLPFWADAMMPLAAESFETPVYRKN